MKIFKFVLPFALITLLSCAPENKSVSLNTESNGMDELNPFDPEIHNILSEMDQDYYEQTGKLPVTNFDLLMPANDCKGMNCTVYAVIKKSEQKLYLYINQKLNYTWLVSTGTAGANETPLLNTHPNGRIYDAYSSTKYPGGDYKGLGNMPYAVFIYNGFAIHGTAESNWKMLGKKASHGCIRIHPDNAYIFNRLVKQYGIYKVWIQVTH